MAAPKSTSGRRNATSKPADPATPNASEENPAKDAPEAEAATEEQSAVAAAQDGEQAQDEQAPVETTEQAQDAPATPEHGDEATEDATPDVTAEKDEMQAEPDTPAAGSDEVEGIWVRSVKASFRRCGMRFTREGFGIALDALKEGQLEILEQEPNLVVERMTFTDERMTR